MAGGKLVILEVVVGVNVVALVHLAVVGLDAVSISILFGAGPGILLITVIVVVAIVLIMTTMGRQ